MNNRDTPDDELIDILITISVVAKRLAENLKKAPPPREPWKAGKRRTRL